ncbi:sugar nucleotide-binding protein [Brevundimonas diminuta]|uniref:sugar nucleotide-binding protein n=1 Tax=Brevundimonas diminuta TaxID=293 RepID=UPI00338F756D
MTCAARVLVTGSGRVARALARRPWPQGLMPIYRSRSELDLTTANLSRELDEIKADIVINTAAWTDVDVPLSFHPAATRV